MTTFSDRNLSGESVLERFESGEIFIPFNDLTILDITGKDRAKIMGNITTNHVAALEPGQGCETFITDARGKAFGHGLIYAIEDRLRLITVADQFERLSAQIDRYVIREDVQVLDRSKDFYTVFWPGTVGSVLAKHWDLAGAAAPNLVAQPRCFEGTEGIVYQVPWTSDSDWLFLVEAASAESLDAALVQHDVLPGHKSLLHCGRIKHRYPWYGLDCDDSNLPQELDRIEKTINFKKGCYLGQETIARLDALGQVQKKLLLWRFDGESVPDRGAELKDGEKVVATITSSGYCFAAQAPIALAMTRRSHFTPGSKAVGPGGEAGATEG